MENKYLIDLSIQYGLDSSQVSKLVDMVDQCGLSQIDSPKAKKIVNFICDSGLIEEPAEEVIEKLRRKGFIQ